MRTADENVGRFDVAVDDIRGMCGVQCVSDLDPEPQHRIEAEWTGGDAVLQRRALQSQRLLVSARYVPATLAGRCCS